MKEEEQILAPYAMKSSLSVGRVYPEAKDPFRLPFQRDRDRILHSKAFRRLQAKTQVFVSYFGDHYRDRMTHSIEVAQIARDLSRSLGLNEDLAECLSLAHDLGHPPFGHGGEYALDEAMSKFGLHFEHNEQSRRIIEKLEKIYPAFDGLNASKEVLDGLLKHNPHHYKTHINFIAAPHLEGQIMDLSDEIAYTNHDVDDGLRSGILTETDLGQFKIWRDARSEVLKKYGDRNIGKSEEASYRIRSRIISTMISRMIHDLQSTTSANLSKNKIDSIEKVRACPKKLVTFSPPMRRQIQEFRDFLLEHFYNHPKVATSINKGKKILKNLFSYYRDYPSRLPPPFPGMIKSGEPLEVVVKDYIAGMTDHYAEEQWEKIRGKKK